MRTDDAARLLGVSPWTLKYWRAMRRGPTFYRLGRQVRYQLAELEIYLRERQVRARSKKESEAPAA